MSAVSPLAKSDRDLRRRAMAAEMLDAETERALARAWRERGDDRALTRLITAYLRLAAASAARYRRYGAPAGDLLQEAVVGLASAARRFDPDRGVRFSTYAKWWIRASIQEFLMRDWSMVRVGSTSPQKALFFNLRRVKARLEREAGRDFGDGAPPDAQAAIARELRAPLRDVEAMTGRLTGRDYSLNMPLREDGDAELGDTLADDSPTPEDAVRRRADGQRLGEWIAEAMDELSEREKLIISERRLSDAPPTLAAIGERLGVSKERVRQLEAEAMSKMREKLERRVGPAIRDLAREES